jgi:hypothetical protein
MSIGKIVARNSVYDGNRKGIIDVIIILIIPHQCNDLLLYIHATFTQMGGRWIFPGDA